MIKYFIRQYWRYIAMALAFASITFLSNACEVHAETATLSPSSLTLKRYYGNNVTTVSTPNCHNNTCYWNPLGNATSYRWTLNNSYTVSDVDVITFNMYFWQSASGVEYPITEVAFGEYECFYARDEDYINDTEPTNLGYSISAICMVNGTLNLPTGSKAVNVTFNNTGGEGSHNKVALSNITMTKDSKLLAALQSFQETNQTLGTISSNITWVLQAQGTTNYWAEYNSGVLEQIKGALTSQTSAIEQQTQQQHSDAQAQKESTDAINNSINNSSTDDPTNDLNDMTNNEISNSVISDLLLLPVNMFQKILNSINGTCNTFSLGSLFGTNLTLPCINIENYIGSTLWGAIDVIFCGMFMLSMRKKFVDIFENITSLKDRGNELE